MTIALNPIAAGIAAGIVNAPTASEGATLAFHALTPDTGDDMKMVGVLTGTGGLTTTHTAVLYAPDFNGVYQKFPANAPVWSGGRCVLTGGVGTDVVSVHANDAPAGTPLSEAPYLQYYPAAQNEVQYSNDASNSYWGSSTTTNRDQVGLTGEPNTATRSSVTGILSVNRQSIPVTAGVPTTAKLWIRKEASVTAYPGVTLAHAAPADDRCDQTIDPINGQLITRTGVGSNSRAEIIDDGDFWLILLESTSATSTLVNYSIYPAVAATFTGSWGGSHTGEIVIAQLEIHDGKTIAEVRGLGPIFTTTAAVATDASVYSFDIANHAQEASYYSEWEPSWQQNELFDLSRRNGLISLRLNSDASLLYMDRSDQLTSYDSSTSVTLNAPSFSAFAEQKLALVYYGSQRALNWNNTYGTEGSYDGAYDVSRSAISLFNRDTGNTYISQKFRELQRYDITSYQEGKDQIDALMGS